ncbi:MAG: bifunctional pyr operon transcriptional regulator/uracil phosphoribosyltransferase PyrR [Burkholderiaceae bacterium]
MPPTAAPEAETLYASLKQTLAAHVVASARVPRLVGIHSGGTWIAERLHRDLGLEGAPGALDISFYRDDFNRIGLHGQVKPTELDFDVDGADILLVDDVLYTGRTLRGALNVLFDFGRPARVDLAVLVDRQTPAGDAREMPIAARWSGARLTLARDSEFVLSRDSSEGGDRFRFEIAQTPRVLTHD